MKPRSVVLLLVMILASAGVLGWLLSKKGDKALVLSGSIEARDVEIGSLTGGRVAKVLAEEGARVAAGQPIVQFETDLIDLQIQQEAARVDQARANLTKALRGPRNEETARARAQADNAERERLRLKALLDRGVVPQQQYDDAATQARVARETALELERGNRPEDIAVARATLEAEEKQQGYLERQRAESLVRAPAAGVIESMDLRPGDLVVANQPVSRMLEPSQLWVRVYVPEPQLG
jgi:HlyD family secretion protein